MNFFKNIPPRTKFKLLLWSLPIVVFILYKLGISKTVNEIHLYKTLNANLQKSGQTNDEEKRQQLNNRQLLEKYKVYILDTTRSENNLFTTISDFSNTEGVKLMEYEISGMDTASGSKIITRKVTLRGKYKEMVKLIHLLETKNQAGRISSVAFKSSRDQKTDSIYLDCSLYIQNLIK
jgi:hypothetical protein